MTFLRRALRVSVGTGEINTAESEANLVEHTDVHIESFIFERGSCSSSLQQSSRKYRFNLGDFIWCMSREQNTTPR